jgi:hypothetical protein
MVDGRGIGEAIGCLFATAIIGVILTIIFGGGLIYSFFSKDKIESTKPIQPQIELVIEDNKVDTIYVYIEP